MNKKLLYIFAILFFPVAFICYVIKFFIKSFNNKRIYNFLSQIKLSDIDSLSGYDFEEILSYLFRYFGFKTTITKKSGDYGVDIFAKNKSLNYCIQAKLYYNHNVGASAIQQIETGKRYFACDYAVVVTNSRYTKQAIDMARQLNVILFAREDLKLMLNELRKRNKKFLKKYMEEKICLKK